MVHLAYLMLLLPLAGFLFLVTFGRRLGDPVAGVVGTVAIGGAFVVACVVLAGLLAVAAVGAVGAVAVLVVVVDGWRPAGQHDGADDGDDQQGGGGLEGEEVGREELLAQLGRLARR